MSHLIVACPNCHKLNRIPKAKLGDNGNCGSCKLKLFTKKPIELTQADFSKHSVKSDIPIIIDFWAPWCGPCKMISPILEQAAISFEPKLKIGKVNTEIEQSLGSQFSIRSIPTLVLFHKGKEISRVSGAMNYQQLDQWAKSNLATI